MERTDTADGAKSGPAREASPAQAEMTDRQLAEAVLARTLRPRAADIRRLAEAVLAKSAKKTKDGVKKAAGKKAKGHKA